GEEFCSALGRVPLADPAEVDAHAGAEFDPSALDRDPSAACGSGGGGGRPVACDFREGPVVAGGEKRVVDRRVEASVSALPGSDGELDDAEEMGRGIDRARSVQFREL